MDKENTAPICYRIPKKLKKLLVMTAADEEIPQTKIVIEALSKHLGFAC